MMTSSDCQRTETSKQLQRNYSNWSLGFDFLLDDPQGIKEFESFLKNEGCNAYLEFLWACEGMKNIGTSQMYLPQIINCIYKSYIDNGSLSNSSTDSAIIALRDRMKMSIAKNTCNVDFFNELETQVVLHLKSNMYPQFLKSSIFSKAGEELRRTFTPVNEEVSASDMDIHGKINKIVEWRKSSEHQYGRKIVFVLNNDDLPVHQTFTPSLREAKPHVHIVSDPNAFVRELTEKLEMLKFKQDRREEKEQEAVWKRANQKHFYSKLSEALREVFKNEDLPMYSNYNYQADDKETQEHAAWKAKAINSNGNECKAVSTRKSSLKKYFQTTIWKHKRITKASKMQNSISFPTGSLKQPDGKSKFKHTIHFPKKLSKSKSLSLDFGDSGLELSETLDEQPCPSTKSSKKYASSFQRIQSWINDCHTGISNDDEKRILV